MVESVLLTDWGEVNGKIFLIIPGNLAYKVFRLGGIPTAGDCTSWQHDLPTLGSHIVVTRDMVVKSSTT